jgi:Ribbon-helix-helix protein, copG family
VYAVCMLTTRLQVLITPEQKRRLDAEAAARGESVGGLVREAIDERYGRRFTREERLRAVQEICAMPPASFVSPEELGRMHAQEIERQHPEIFAPDKSR